jgi:hypothetical protein
VVFSPPPGSKLPGPPQLLSSTGLVARNGLSLARNGSPFRGLHSGVNVPGLLLRHRLSRSQTRSAFRSTTASGSPRSRPLPCFGPLPVRFFARSTLPPASTPLRDFYIPLDRSVQPASRRSVRLPAPPDFLSLPASSSISRLGIGSSFLVRYVSGGSLFLLVRALKSSSVGFSCQDLQRLWHRMWPRPCGTPTSVRVISFGTAS